MTRFKLLRVLEINVAKPTPLEIAALTLVLAFALLLVFWR